MSNRNNRNNPGRGQVDDADERIGSMPGAQLNANVGGDEDGPESSKYGEPMLPIVNDSENEVFSERVGGDTRYTRDDSDRDLQERSFDDRDLTDAERLEMFRMSMFQSSLPSLPAIPGFHCCWLTTTNPRDSVHARIRLGYSLIRSSEIPGWEHATITTGEYAGCVGINEMIAAKLPLRLYELYMTEAHHNAPLAEEGKLTSALEAVQQQAGKKVQVFAEEGQAALGKPRRPKFEGLSG